MPNHRPLALRRREREFESRRGAPSGIPFWIRGLGAIWDRPQRDYLIIYAQFVHIIQPSGAPRVHGAGHKLQPIPKRWPYWSSVMVRNADSPRSLKGAAAECAGAHDGAPLAGEHQIAGRLRIAAPMSCPRHATAVQAARFNTVVAENHATVDIRSQRLRPAQVSTA